MCRACDVGAVLSPVEAALLAVYRDILPDAQRHVAALADIDLMPYAVACGMRARAAAASAAAATAHRHLREAVERADG